MRGEAPLVQVVLGLWHEVLGNARALRPDSNFFLSGGDSLDLMRVLVRIRERTGVELELRDAAKFSTPRRMAEFCAQSAPRTRLPARCDPDELADDSYPCTSAQAGMWLAEMACGTPLYNTAVVLHFAGALNATVLARALDAVVQQQEVLRTRLRFDVRLQRLMAEVAAQQVPLVSQRMPRARARDHFSERAAQPFDAAAGPLWRFELAWTDDARAALLVCLHHTLIDGWSGGVLLGQLATAYNLLLQVADWSPATTDREFRRFALQQRQVPERDVLWWRNYLDGADQLHAWPYIDQRWPFALACEEFAIEGTLVAAACAAAARMAVAPSALFLTALRLALRALHEVADVCIAVPCNARATTAQEQALGCFVNLLVARTRLGKAMGAQEALRAVSADQTELLRRRHVPFQELARRLGPAPLPSGNAWCDILFAYQRLPAVSASFDGLEVQVERLPPRHGQHPLKLEYSVSEHGCVCRIEYARDLLDVSAVRALHGEIARQLAVLGGLAPRSS